MSVFQQSDDYRRWMALAHSELGASGKLLEGSELYPFESCYLAQQAAEKAIKAGLVRSQIEFPYRHNLDLLVDLLPDNWNTKREFPDLAQLSQWAVDTRYPGNTTLPTVEEAKSAVALAARIVESIERDIQDENE